MSKEDRIKRREARRKNRKSFGETAVGKFLKNSGSTIVDIIGEIAPKGSVLDNVANLITKDKELSPEDKEIALKLLEMDKAELDNVSARWDSDLTSDSWLSKNIRPLVLGYLVFVTTLIIVLDSVYVLDVAEEWIILIKAVLTTVVISYFGSRGIEKTTKHIY